jgi:hypothetical protein
MLIKKVTWNLLYDTNENDVNGNNSMVSCRDCSNLALITERGDFERRCIEGLKAIYEDHDCGKYNRLITSCSCCN